MNISTLLRYSLIMESDWNFVISMVGHDRSDLLSAYAKFSQKLTFETLETLSLLF